MVRRGVLADVARGRTGRPDPRRTPPDHVVTPGLRQRPRRIASASITLDAPIPAPILVLRRDRLIALRGPDILRMKGIVHIEGVPRPVVLHGVEHIVEPPVPLDCTPDTARAAGGPCASLRQAGSSCSLKGQ
ncbi:MAG: GTP-binding protein [Rubellimicrobium sp.]|nr:GTP-binding protein [Rubellimicrobium sp.]